MTDFIGVINSKALEVYKINEAKDLWRNPNIPEKCMLICCDIAKAVEADKKALMDTHIKHRRGLEVELAKALICILDLSGYLQIDLGGAVTELMVYNKQTRN